MSAFVENFTEQRLVSWHPRGVNLARVREDDSVAADYRKNYRISLVDLGELANIVCYRAWAPIVWLEGTCLSSNFIASHWMALDFENQNYTLKQALKDWSDSPHVIGLTKSHGFAKVKDPAMDRFRIIVPLEKPILDVNTYEFNVGQLIKRYHADETCVDGARFFFPCREIVSVNLDGYLQPVLTYTPPEKIKVNTAHLIEQRRALFGKALPRWVSDFVKHGKMPPFHRLRHSRKWVCWAVGRELLKLGWSRPEIESLLHEAQFDRTRFHPKEIDQAVKSALKKGPN